MERFAQKQRTATAELISTCIQATLFPYGISLINDIFPTSESLKGILCGEPRVDRASLLCSCAFKDFEKEMFSDLLHAMDSGQIGRLLMFCTGTNVFSTLTRLNVVGTPERCLPSTRTCFHQLFLFKGYQTVEELKADLLRSLSHSVQFEDR